MNFAALLEKYDWKPIYGCPGRYILKSHNTVTPAQLAECAVPVAPVRSASVPDPVIIIKIEGGGIISYCKKRGQYLHTLADEDGFFRKLSMLGFAGSDWPPVS